MPKLSRIAGSAGPTTAMSSAPIRTPTNKRRRILRRDPSPDAVIGLLPTPDNILHPTISFIHGPEPPAQAARGAAPGAARRALRRPEEPRSASAPRQRHSGDRRHPAAPGLA